MPQASLPRITACVVTCVPGLLVRIVEVGCLQARVEHVRITFTVNTHHLTRRMTSTPGSVCGRIQKMKRNLIWEYNCLYVIMHLNILVTLGYAKAGSALARLYWIVIIFYLI